jgi:hypothetical protein
MTNAFFIKKIKYDILQGLRKTGDYGRPDFLVRSTGRVDETGGLLMRINGLGCPFSEFQFNGLV